LDQIIFLTSIRFKILFRYFCGRHVTNMFLHSHFLFPFLHFIPKYDIFSLTVSATPSVVLLSNLRCRLYRVVTVDRISGFLVFVHRPVLLGVETRCFGNWIRFRPQMKGREDTYSDGHLRKRRGPTE
jgi:hypothetical protein